MDRSKEKGSVLLLSLLIVIGTVAAAVSFATLIISNLQRARLAVFSLDVYYTAESGIEQALYRIRKEHADPAALGSCISGCSRSATYSAQATFASISQDQTAQLDLFNTSGTINAGIQRIEIDCPKTTFPDIVWLDINYTPVLDSGGGWVTDQGNIAHSLKPCDGESIILTQGLNSAYSYILRIKPLYANSPQITVRAYDSSVGGNLVTPASELTLISAASSSIVEQRIIVRMPRRTPVSAFYDYVIFSEETIQKVQTSGFTNS